jgi:hypothetical protein
MIPNKEYFDLASRDSMSWLEFSERLKFSSEVIYNKLQSFIELLLSTHDYENEDKIKALWNSYYLLIGHSFENLIKGLSVENNRDAKTFNGIYKNWKKHYQGHGISKIAQENLSDLTIEQIKLLERLETYIIWAGRYYLPSTPEKFNNERSLLYFDSKDYDLINSFYDKIKTTLLSTYKKNEK